MNKHFEQRKYLILGIIIITGLIILIKLFYLQIINEEYKVSALNNSQRHIIQYPPRGIIYDRDSNILASNTVAYDIMVIPGQVKPFDTVQFASQLNISVKKFKQRLLKARHYSYFKASVFFKLLSAKEYASFQEYIHHYRGFYVQPRLVRDYPQKLAPHVLGDVGEVGKKMVESDDYYQAGDYIGLNGLEKYYEKELRGEKGLKIYLVDAHNRIKESFHDGMYDKKPVAGKNLICTIDSRLQAYGKKLMRNKLGGLVAIEPKTGEILAMVSNPNYNPNILIGRKRGYYYDSLLMTDHKPLFNRAVNAAYPPGSTFKVAQAIVALDEGVIDVNTAFSCNKALIGCHNHPNASSITEAIQYSCNPYFHQVFKRLIQRGYEESVFRDSPLGLDLWKQKISNFGFGSRLDIGLPSVNPGFIPGSDYYNRLYGEYRWAFSTIYSLSIGQGEIGVTPVQLANFASIIANRGWYYTPHLIKRIEERGLETKYKQKHVLPFDTSIYAPVVDGMEGTVNGDIGTARLARIEGIILCGKTGTAENPHGEDHSIFMAFAPKENPQIAIAVYVENSGYGGTWAGPIASLMAEKYLLDTIQVKWKEDRILDAELIPKEEKEETTSSND
ncbi:MAG: penicillin-binding protein 2 [Candidatus Delongbacteria bacterium]|jgi:penicillin-binding protein 2|nr:penicillin-binding protein 2 [Candidatus Delongbacteria bacterium]